jgi:hypothetical protein
VWRRAGGLLIVLTIALGQRGAFYPAWTSSRDALVAERPAVTGLLHADFGLRDNGVVQEIDGRGRCAGAYCCAGHGSGVEGPAGSLWAPRPAVGARATTAPPNR